MSATSVVIPAQQVSPLIKNCFCPATQVRREIILVIVLLLGSTMLPLRIKGTNSIGHIVTTWTPGDKPDLHGGIAIGSVRIQGGSHAEAVLLGCD